MSAITTHVLDTTRGSRRRPVCASRSNMRADSGEWQSIGRGVTDADGRLRTLLPEGQPLTPGVYRLTFDTRAVFRIARRAAFYPEVVVTFETAAG